MGFAIDGSNSAVTPNFASNTASLAATLTTSSSCVVWAAVYNLGFSKQSLSKSTITDNSGQGLTWVFAAGSEDFAAHGYLELWYAKTSAPFSTVTITATFATATETAGIIVWGEDGIGNTVLDPNAALPIQQAYNSSSASETESISTNSATSVGFMVSGCNGQTPGISAGWTQIAAVTQPNNDNYNTEMTVWYQIFNSPQSGLSVTMSRTGATDMNVLGVAAQGVTLSTTKGQPVFVGF